MTAIADEIARISQNVSDSLEAVSTYGVSVPSDATSDDLSGLIMAVPTINVPVPVSQGGTGADTSDDALTNLGAASAVYVSELEARISQLEQSITFTKL